jgi:hypothetical protein
MEKYTGLDIDKEIADQQGDEWQFGAGSLKPLFTIPSIVDRADSLPSGEVQRGKEDMMDCATRGPINYLEALFTYGVRNKKFSEKNIVWLIENGYVDEGLRVTFSDAFNAIKSGTRRTGNSMKAPIHSIYSYGLIPKKMLPLEKSMTWDQYHNPARITQEMEDLARVFSKRFTINYEQVGKDQIKNLNKGEMLVVAGYAWPKPIRNIYPRTDNKINHVFLLIKPEYYAFDNYVDADGNDFVKTLTPDYKFYDYAYRIFISAENDAVVDEWWSVSVLSKIVESLKNIVELLKKKGN